MASIQCEFCKKQFTVKNSLNVHQRTAKYCLALQGKNASEEFECEFCNKSFTLKQTYQDHLLRCKTKNSIDLNKKYQDYESYIDQLKSELNYQTHQNIALLADIKHNEIILKERDSYISKLENALYKANQRCYENPPLTVDEKIKDVVNTINNPDISVKQEKQLIMKERRIKYLEEICLSKQQRVEYPERNVVYILTTDDHLKRRTYIIGKAKNLTSRLGTYNKTCNHIVVYYRECKNEDDMTTAENLVLSKLKGYREQANRDRFVLPFDKNISFFIKTIDQCIDFL